MDDKHSESSPKLKDWFPSTHWSVILQAARDGDPGGQAALEKVCQTYWKPIFGFVRRKGHPWHEAEDLTQDFITRFLARGISIAPIRNADASAATCSRVSSGS